MSKYALAAAIALASVLAASGCGGQGSASEGDVAVESLLRAKDMPEKASLPSAPPSPPCSPIPVLESNGGQVAQSPLFAFGKVQIREAVGVFETPEAAAAAYEALNSEERLECIDKAIESVETSGDKSVKRLHAYHLENGDREAVVRYVIMAANSNPLRSVNVASIKSGKRVAALIFLLEVPIPDAALINETSITAAELLADESG